MAAVGRVAVEQRVEELDEVPQLLAGLAQLVQVGGRGGGADRGALAQRARGAACGCARRPASAHGRSAFGAPDGRFGVGAAGRRASRRACRRTAASSSRARQLGVGGRAAVAPAGARAGRGCGATGPAAAGPRAGSSSTKTSRSRAGPVSSCSQANSPAKRAAVAGGRTPLICPSAERVRRTATRRSWRNSGSRSARTPGRFASSVPSRCSSSARGRVARRRRAVEGDLDLAGVVARRPAERFEHGGDPVGRRRLAVRPGGAQRARRRPRAGREGP